MVSLAQVLAPLLQKALKDHLDIGSQHLEVLSGRVALSSVGIRPQREEGLPAEISGHVGRIEATWTWSDLWRQPVNVEVSDLTVVLALGHGGDSLKAQSSPAMDRRSQNLLDRLRKRIIDQLNLTVHRVHLRLEGRRNACPQASGGLVFERLRVAGASWEHEALRQEVSLEALGLYVASGDGLPEPDPLPAAIPASWFLIQGASPSCTASRSSGRRFVDLQGLELCATLQDLEVTCARQHLTGILGLYHQVFSLGEAVWEAEEVFHDCEEEAESQRSGHRTWWEWVLRSSPSTGEVELPDLPEADTAALTEQEALAPNAGFSVTLDLPNLTVFAMDSGLELSAAGRVNCGFYDNGRWDMGGLLAKLMISERRPGSARHIGGLSDASGEVRLSAQACGSDAVVSIVSSRLDLQITPATCRLSSWLRDVPQQFQVAEPSQTSWRWTLDLPVTILVAKPWHERMLQLGVHLSCDQSTRSEFTVSAKVDGRALIEECVFELQTTKDLRATASTLSGSCDVGDIILLVRAAKGIWNTFCVADEDGIDSSRGQTCMKAELLIADLKMAVCDVDLALTSRLRSRSLQLSSDGDTSWLHADVLDMSVEQGGESLGSLQLVGPHIGFASGSTAGLEGQLDAAVLLRDPAFENVAISCPSVRCKANVQAEDRPIISIDVEVSSGINISTSETFLQRCRLAANYAYDLLATALCVEPVLLEERPFGICVENTEVTATAGTALKLRLPIGSTICGMEPPAEDLITELGGREVPFILLFQAPVQQNHFALSVKPLIVEATQISIARGVTATLAQARIALKEVQLRMEGSYSQLLEKVAARYLTQVAQGFPQLFCHLTVGSVNLFEGALSSAGTSLAMLRYGGMATGTGALAGTLTKGLATAAQSSLARGRELRGVEEGYRLGDFTRGVLSLSRERGRRVLGRFDDRAGSDASQSLAPEAPRPLLGTASVVVGAASGVASHAYNTSAVSQTAGAALGGALLAPLGPVGLTAGMMGGMEVGRRASAKLGDQVRRFSDGVAHTAAQGREARTSSEVANQVWGDFDDAGEGEVWEGDVEARPVASDTGSYQFGDVTRGVLRAGRESRGDASGQGYKFGDLSRGLWTKMRGK